jgi:hypothetical protein
MSAIHFARVKYLLGLTMIFDNGMRMHLLQHRLCEERQAGENDVTPGSGLYRCAVKERFQVSEIGCGLFQTEVACEGMIPLGGG